MDKKNNNLRESDGTEPDFIENKGQISDQNFNTQTDILFAGSVKGVAYFLRKGGISYQFYRTDSWEKKHNLKTKTDYDAPNKISVYRLDLKWIAANLNAEIIKGERKTAYNNYYLQNCPNGVHGVYTYKDITYKNIYRGIDLYYYQKDGNLKYDYIINSGTDYRQIKIVVEGADRIELKKNGSLIIHTEFGIVEEDAPYAEQNGQEIHASWVIEQDTLSFKLGKYDSTKPLILDPFVRVWGTYYGGNTADIGWGCAKDYSGNIFLTGATWSSNNLTIATSGSHKSIFNGKWLNAFLTKFNNNGVRLWGTYYGGVADGGSHSCVADKQGNVYICGYVGPEAGNTIATPGSHQAVNAGGVYDAFLAKFNSNGVRQWGTYYGGASEESASSCAIDIAGNIYMTGVTSSTTGIASAGSHQNSLGGNYDAFLVKFDSSGVRDWGTYYGSTMMEQGQTCATDPFGNVYLAGYSGSLTSTLIATPNSHQPTSGGNFDSFLVKFNAQGTRQWGTYYGGGGMDGGMGCVTDSVGNIYFCGFTTSIDSISTLGTYQKNYGGGSSWGDAFVTKFNMLGQRLWGSYYGGSGEDWSSNCAVDATGNVFLIGTTNSDSIDKIATVGSTQMTFGGGISDAFVAAFDNTGQRIAGTYYGAQGRDEGMDCAINSNRSVFIAGVTDSNTMDTMSTSGSHQVKYGGGQWDAFLGKLNMCVQLPSVRITLGDSSICEGESEILTAIGASTYSWSTGTLGNTISVAPTTNTIYIVMAKDIDGCADTSSVSLSVLPCTLLNSLEDEHQEIIVFPIPSYDQVISIQRQTSDSAVLTIVNSIGLEVLRSKLHSKFSIIDLSILAKGVYVLLITDKTTLTKKIILD